MNNIKRTLANLLVGVSSFGLINRVTAQECMEHNNHCYSLTPTNMSWTQSEDYAVSLGGHLVTINDGQKKVG